MIRRPSPLVQMTLALVGLCGMLVILADLFFAVLPDRGEQAMRWRKNVSEAVAVQVAVLLAADDPGPLQRTLDSVVARTEGMQSLAIRRADGSIVAQAGDHARHWQPVAGDASIPEQVTVPLNAGGARWGSFELAFARDEGHVVVEFLRQPLVLTLGFISLAGTLAFGLYLRRALQHLDPASVIPERVQGAFDAMVEGVVVMDTRGRVLLTNKSFRALHDGASALRLGHSLSAAPWLAACLPADVETHPWAVAISARRATAGATLEVGHGLGRVRHLVVNCVPITDPGGAVRGCLATFDDVSELHHTNAALRDANDALNRAQQEVQRQNTELQRLATRDPLTDCLNRRAFHAALQPMFAEARSSADPLSCLMIDIDHFKKVNDTHGHQVGDRVIQEVAKTLVACARPTDLVCRYGGEEFCVVLRGTPLAAAQEFAERVRHRIETECGSAVREVQGMRVTASLGLEMLSHHTASPAELIDHADQALYRAKKGGRNQVCVHLPAGPAASDTADTDVLTGCLGWPAFQRAWAALRKDASAQAQVLSGIQFAVEPYQALVADSGQQAADEAVRAVAQIVLAAVRPGDLVLRVDAQHLAVVAPGLPIQAALALAQTVRARVAQCADAAPQGSPAAHRLTVSAGVDALPADAPEAAALIERAGKALLHARRGGRNQVRQFAGNASTTSTTSTTSTAEAAAVTSPDAPDVHESIAT